MEHYTLCRKCSEQHKERVIHQMPECTDKIDWKARAEKAEAEVTRLKEQVATVLRRQERSSVVQDLKRALARAEKAEARLKDVQDIVNTWDEHNAEQVLYTLDILLDD